MGIRNRIALVGVLALVMATTAVAASADEPSLEAEGFPWSYTIENPCSGGFVDVLEVADVYEHAHVNNSLSQPNISVTADSGFEGFAIDIGVSSAGGELVNHRVMLTNRISGEKIQITIRGIFDPDLGEWRLGGDQLVRCVGG